MSKVLIYLSLQIGFMCLLGACAASDGQMCYMYCVRLFLQVSSVRIEASFWRRLLLMCVLCAFGILPHYTFRIVGYPISSSKLYHYPVPKLHEALASLTATTLCKENCLSCNNMHQCCALHNKRIGQLNAFMEKVNDFLPQSSLAGVPHELWSAFPPVMSTARILCPLKRQ